MCSGQYIKRKKNSFFFLKDTYFNYIGDTNGQLYNWPLVCVISRKNTEHTHNILYLSVLQLYVSGQSFPNLCAMCGQLPFKVGRKPSFHLLHLGLVI